MAVPLAVIGADTASGPLLDAILSSDRGVLDPIGFWSFPPGSGAPPTRILLRAVENFDTLDMLLNAADCVYIASRKVDWLAVARIALGKGKAVVCERPSYLRSSRDGQIRQRGSECMAGVQLRYAIHTSIQKAAASNQMGCCQRTPKARDPRLRVFGASRRS